MPKQDRLEILMDAMEEHGNDTGTETQLGDSNEFLRQLFGMLTPEKQDEFLLSNEVQEFINRETTKTRCTRCNTLGIVIIQRRIKHSIEFARQGCKYCGGTGWI